MGCQVVNADFRHSTGSAAFDFGRPFCGFLSDSDLVRNTEQIGVGEFNSGPLCPIVPKHFIALFAELIVQSIRKLVLEFVVRLYGDEVQLEGSQLERPNDSVFIVVLLDDGG
jgi:hypothetical protein